MVSMMSLLCYSFQHCSSSGRILHSWSVHLHQYLPPENIVLENISLKLFHLHQTVTLFLTQFLPEIHHHMLELRPWNKSISILKENIFKKSTFKWGKTIVCENFKDLNLIHNEHLPHQTLWKLLWSHPLLLKCQVLMPSLRGMQETWLFQITFTSKTWWSITWLILLHPCPLHWSCLELLPSLGSLQAASSDCEDV